MKKNLGKINTSNILLTLISGLLGIIAFFLINFVGRFDQLAKDYHKTELVNTGQHSELKQSLGNIEVWMGLIKPMIADNTSRSLSNESRLNIIEGKQ